MFKAHRLLYHSTLGLSVMKKKKRFWGPSPVAGGSTHSLVSSRKYASGLGFGVWGSRFGSAAL